jgi:hypothetical protein
MVVGRFARSLVLVACASVVSSLSRNGWARVGGQVAMQRVDILLLLLLWQRCACKLACMFVRTLLAASDEWGRIVVRYACDGGGGGVFLVFL